MAAEAAVQQGFVLAAALREDVLPEGGGRRAVEDAPLLEERESVRLEDFRPLVGVVAGGVAAVEDVVEGGRDAAARDVRQDGAAGEGLRLNGYNVIPDLIGDLLP